MYKKLIKSLLIPLLFPCLLVIADTNDITKARERLQSRIDRDQKVCKKGLLKALLPDSWTPFISEVCKESKNLESLVEQTPPVELPNVLVNILIDEYTGGPSKGEYPPMRDYLKVFGEPAADPLMERYGDMEGFHKGDVLRILGEIGSENALPFIRSELKEKKLLTLEPATYAIRMIRKEASKEDLLPLLSDPELDAKSFSIIVRQLSSLENPGWFNIVLDMLEQGKIDFQIVADLGYFTEYPEPIIAAHLGYLIDQWNSDKTGTVSCLLLQLHERTNIKKLFPILDDLLRADFWYAGTNYSSLRSKCRYLSQFNRPILLARIEDTLTKEDIEEWMYKPSPGWLSYLYLHDLYYEKGGPPLDTSEMFFDLDISVYDEAGDVLLGQTSETFKSNVRRDVVIGLKSSNDVSYQFSFTPRLYKQIGQQESWFIYVNDFRAEKPKMSYGNTFRINVGSKTHFKTFESNGRVAKWEVTHTGPPPADIKRGQVSE